VLADVVMPGKSGYEVCEAIKTDPDLENVPVLLLTGTFEAFDEERARQAGADGHITKPFEAQALVDQVNALLARSAAAATSAAAEPSAPGPASDADTISGRAAAPAASYDFFDDEATEPGAAPVLGQGSPEATAPAEIDDLALGETGGQSFRFDTPPDLGDDLEVPAIPDPPGGTGDETVLLSAGSSLLEQPDPDATGPGLGAAEDASLEPTAEPIFDALDDVSTLPGAAAAANPDPDRRHAYDVSSTDLGSPLAGGPTAEPRRSPDETVIMSEPLVAAEPEAPASLAFSPEPPPIPEATVAEEPVSEPILAAPQPVNEPAPEPAAELPALAFDGPAPAGAAAIEEPVDAPRPVAEASAESGATPEISPATREEIRTALEKVAWEAFGSVAENLVKEAIERIEKIAWEVVPQLAETLVQEEIRRMKDE
jgi:hypothetical protein